MSNLSTKIELHLRCLNLPKMDLFSKSDPFVVIYIKQGKDEQVTWLEVFRTSTIDNESNPEWSDHIIMEYHFETMQEIKFEVYDRDSKSEKLSAHDFIGEFYTSVSKIMGSRGCTVSDYLARGKKPIKGKIIVSAQEVDQTADIIKLQLKADKVDRKNWFGLGKSDPFYVFSQKQGDGSFVKVYESEVVKNNLNPRWKQKDVPLQRLCNGDLNRPLLFEVFDWESNGQHQFIGSAEISISYLINNDSFPIQNQKKKKKKQSGLIRVLSSVVEKRYSFLEYIQGGLDMNLMIAVDFTASNGHPLDAISLHKLPEAVSYTGSERNVRQLNQYQSAIWSVGRILQDYDSDNMIPVYGFGAQKDGQISHCFPLTFDEKNDEVYGIDGVMKVYEYALQQVNLSGPTYFAQILKKAKELATQASQQDDQYVILLILTDGIINDMDRSIQQIVQSASLPLSIIIVGVGDADFSNMEELDGDEVRLSYMGKKAERDIVQFVPFTEFIKAGPTALAAEVLQEIPEQLVSYFNNRGIKPKPKREASERHFNAFNSSRKVVQDNIPMVEEIVPMAEVIPEGNEKM